MLDSFCFIEVAKPNDQTNPNNYVGKQKPNLFGEGWGGGKKTLPQITQNETVYLKSSVLPGENLAVGEPVVGRSLLQFS